MGPPLDDVSALLEAVFNVGRSSRHGLRRRRLFQAASLGASDPPSPLKARGALEAARRARALRLAGRDAEALAGFERALSLGPACAAALAWRWEARWRGRADFAGLDRAISLEPEQPGWRVWRALAVLASGSETTRSGDLARGHAERALALAPSTLGWAALALAETRAGRDEAAARAAGEAIALEPRQGWLRRLRAGARLRSGDEAGFLEDCEAETLLDEGIGQLAAVFPTDSRRPGPGLLRAADSFLARRPRAHWMLALRGDCRRSPEINDFAGAVADFRRAAASAPRCAYVQGYLSRALMVQGRTDEALEAIDRALALAPRSGWLRVWRGELLRRLGRPAAALADLDAGLVLDPDYEMGYAWRGGARRAVGRLDEARADLDLAAALDPSYAWTFHERSLVRRARGETEGALADLDAAARLDPKYVWSARPEKDPEGLAALDALLARRPRHAPALAWRGRTRLERGDAGGAAEDLAAAARLDRSAAAPRAWLGRALASLGRPREALAAFDAAVARDPRCVPALAGRGRLLLELGRARAAWDDLNRASQAWPLAAWLWQLKGEAGLRLRRWAESASDLTRALELERGWRPRAGRAAAYARLGRTAAAREDLRALEAAGRRLVAEGRAAEARALADEALRLNPSAAGLRAWRGALRLEAGDFAGALEDAPGLRAARAARLRAAGRLREALAALPRSREPASRARRGELLRALGRPRAALRALDAALAAEPARGWALMARGETLRSLGRAGEGLREVLDAARADAGGAGPRAVLGGAPAEDPTLAWAYAWRGAVARREERWDAAREDLERAARLDPSCAWARGWLGELRLAREDAGAARPELEAAAAAYPRWADAHCWHGRALCALGRCEEAEAAFERALAAEPAHVWTMIASGLCRERRGLAASAKRAFERARRLAPELFAARA